MANHGLFVFSMNVLNPNIKAILTSYFTIDGAGHLWVDTVMQLCFKSDAFALQYGGYRKILLRVRHLIYFEGNLSVLFLKINAVSLLGEQCWRLWLSEQPCLAAPQWRTYIILVVQNFLCLYRNDRWPFGSTMIEKPAFYQITEADDRSSLSFHFQL